jgi:hypothetical protein
MRHPILPGLVISALCTACIGIGAPPDDPPGDDVLGGPDGGGDPTPDGGPAECEPAAVTVPFGNHNAGAACLGCHTGQGAAPRWTLAGTLYDSRDGTAPISAATILVVDAAGVEHRLITASNGNFYTSAAITFPVRVTASKCPDAHSMGAQIGDGNCNGCHTANSSQGRIHLP